MAPLETVDPFASPLLAREAKCVDHQIFLDHFDVVARRNFLTTAPAFNDLSAANTGATEHHNKHEGPTAATSFSIPTDRPTRMLSPPMYTATMEWSECDTDGASPTIKNHSVTHFNGFLYCFGGYDGRKNHATLMLYDLQERRWIRPQHEHDSSDSTMFVEESDIIVQGTPPPGRNGHSATLVEDEDAGARIIVIGGWLGAGPLAASDMHILEINGKQLRWYQPQIRGSPPGPCNMHSADYVRANGEIYVFRGGNGREYLNDLHALNVETLTWRQVETVGAIPQQRANHSSAMMDETGELFIFGGWNGTERLNDIHILDTATSVCIMVATVTLLPELTSSLSINIAKLNRRGRDRQSAACCLIREPV
jgi:hypothetical protein